MRRIALLGLTVALGGCGYNTWWNLPFTTGNNPNRPVADSDNLRRSIGEDVPVQPLLTEPGDIWPGPPPPELTLEDIDRMPTPNSDEQPAPAPNPARGSSVPPDQGAPVVSRPPPRPAAHTALVSPPSANQAGQSYRTQTGTVTTTGGGVGYQTGVTTGGASTVIVPNGNGTSTVIRADGSIETIQTPR